MSNTSVLTSQLNSLLRLTHTEMMIAQTRRSQAASDAIERELAANADKCKQRAQLLSDAITDLGGVPDVVGVAVGRVGASLKAVTEQGQDLTEALLGDLALEHQLLDRARLAKMIAERLEERKTVKVLDRLEVAHTATIDWLMTRLAEVALGGPAAIRPTPVQSMAGLSRRLSQYPVRQGAATINRSADTAGRLRERAAGAVTDNTEKVRELVEAARDIWTAGRNATLKRTEEVADERGARTTARNVNQVRRDLGAVDPSELPIRGYEKLTAATAINRIGRLEDPQDVRAILAYETANKQRKGVTAAAQQQLEQLASRLAAAS
jgi:bacterioferritin (cytochrome b1)